MSTAPAPCDETSPPALWAAARDALSWFLSVFGDAREIVALGMLTPKEHGEMALWLRGLEALVRRLLVIEAAGLEGAPGPARSGGARAGGARAGGARAGGPRGRGVVASDPERPESWIVSFRAVPPARADGPGAGAAETAAARRTAPDLQSPWPLAERLEALARVLDDPGPRVRRLARRLARSPQLARRFKTPPPPAPPAPPASPAPPRRRGPVDAALAAAREQAATAALVWDSG